MDSSIRLEKDIIDWEQGSGEPRQDQSAFVNTDWSSTVSAKDDIRL
jgi:hypothetical protein